MAGAELALGRTVVALRPASHSLLRDDGEEIGYGKLLIATGGSPRRLGFAGGEIIYPATSATIGSCEGAARRPIASSSSEAGSSPLR